MTLAATLWRNPGARIGGFAMLLMLVAALFAPLIATHDPNAIDVAARLSPPTAAHWRIRCARWARWNPCLWKILPECPTRS